MRLLEMFPAEFWSHLLDRIQALGAGASRGALSLALVALVLLLGWLVASVFAAAVRGVLRRVRFDAVVKRTVGERIAGSHDASALGGWAAYWLVFGAALTVALESVGFEIAAPLAQRFEEVLPRILAASMLFALGTIGALVVGAVTRHFLESADVRSAALFGRIVGAVLTGFAMLLALEQLGFAAQFVMASGVVAGAATGLGLALAFGLGCRELARDFLVEYLRSLDGDAPERRK